jgi:hypothetical protein
MLRRDGRPPTELRANDIAHCQTRVIVSDGAAAMSRLRIDGATFISPSLIQLPQRELGFQAGLLVRDPDKHVLHIADD